MLFALQAAVLQLLVCGNQSHGARGLVQLTGLDADQTILDQVDTADALGAGAAVHLLDGLQRGDVAAVDLDGNAFLELDDHFVLDGRERRVVGVGVAVLGRAVPRILKEAGLDGAAPHVLVDGVRGLLGLGNRQLVLLGERDLDVTGQRQVANRADCPQGRVDGRDGNLETHLIVTLAGAAVGDGVGAELVGGAHEVLGDQRTGDGGDQRVHALVHGVGLQGLHAVLVGELVAGVNHIRLDGTAGERTVLDGLQTFAALADIEGHRDDVLAGTILEVRDGHGGVKATGICEYDSVVVCHGMPFYKNKLLQVYTNVCIFMQSVWRILKQALPERFSSSTRASAATASARRRCHPRHISPSPCHRQRWCRARRRWAACR